MYSNVEYELEKGLYLENIGVLLPWNTPRQTLSKLGQPEIFEDSNYNALQLVWRNITCLRGLKCSVSVKLSGKKPFRELDLMTFLTNIDINARDNFKRVNEHIEMHFGKPTKVEIDNWGFPTVEWKIRNVKITHQIFDRFGEYCNLHISIVGNLNNEI